MIAVKIRLTLASSPETVRKMTGIPRAFFQQPVFTGIHCAIRKRCNKNIS
ncbi:hypothetical protein HMPREF1548_02615 [Clostridium sp. KLE 1755]|nr:hypothetical protein HMPREF1548_02615 [Clostridium sp. KLE 1755]